MHRRRSTARRCFALVVFALAGAIPAPSSATAPAIGALEFSLTAQLPSYPCAPPGCTGGTFSGTSAGQLAGVLGTTPWVAAWLPGSSGIASGTFVYVDDCTFPVGIASGSGDLAQGVPFITGQYGPVPGATTPYPIVSVSAPFTFVWSRIGLTAVVTAVISVIVRYAAPGGGFQSVTVVNGHKSVAVAAFAPLGTIPTCAAPAPLQATVVAVDVVAPA